MTPAHYLVLRELPLKAILCGEKREEIRDWRLAAKLAHSAVGLALSRSSRDQRRGHIVAVAFFGRAESVEDRDGFLSDLSSVHIEAVHKLETPVPCTGGLGLRPWPSV